MLTCAPCVAPTGHQGTVRTGALQGGPQLLQRTVSNHDDGDDGDEHDNDNDNDNDDYNDDHDNNDDDHDDDDNSYNNDDDDWGMQRQRRPPEVQNRVRGQMRRHRDRPVRQHQLPRHVWDLQRPNDHDTWHDESDIKLKHQTLQQRCQHNAQHSAKQRGLDEPRGHRGGCRHRGAAAGRGRLLWQAVAQAQIIE